MDWQWPYFSQKSPLCLILRHHMHSQNKWLIPLLIFISKRLLNIFMAVWWIKGYTRVSHSTYTHKIRPLHIRPIEPIASESAVSGTQQLWIFSVLKSFQSPHKPSFLWRCKLSQLNLVLGQISVCRASCRAMTDCQVLDGNCNCELILHGNEGAH